MDLKLRHLNWSKVFFTLGLLVFARFTFAQSHQNLIAFEFEKNDKNIQVIPLANDSNSSSFIIQIVERVKPHYHKHHTETIYVISGTAEMQFGDSTINLKPGDFIEIPKNTVHAVQVTSLEDLKVLSIQAPEFKGVDRHFLKDELKN